MKVVGIIPVRYNSTRFPGKVLALLEGKPMLCHVYGAAASCDMFDHVYVATDSSEIKAVCDTFGFPTIMTKSCHKNPTSRVCEVSDLILSDLYVMIGGDEPLITAGDIKTTIEAAIHALSPVTVGTTDDAVRTVSVVNAVTVIENRDEIDDVSTIKMISTGTDELLYATRSPLPWSKHGHSVTNRKFVSIGVYTKEALNFFAAASQSELERLEEFDLLRFLEYHKRIRLVDIGSSTLSVDTPDDLARVKHILKRRSHEQHSHTI